MSQERYGIRRFALLNTAGYSLGIFPLENPLSVYGANNLGKSASINALQFPILARMSDMSFGKYSLEQSRKFYFASDTSYILVEVMLPHGPHVIGVAGRGPGGGFGHQFFVYQGSLDLDHYHQNGTCLRQRELFANLERAGLKAYEAKPDELRRLLVGGHTSIPLDMTLIPLRSTSEQSLKTFRALFINLLHMREITAAKLKQLFLDAFEHSLRSGSVDYIAATEEAFRDVRRMEQDYQALVAAGPLVEALAAGVAQRELLRGKLHRLSPLLDNLLGTWHDYADARKEELVIQAEHYRREQDGLQNEQRGGTAELMRLEREISEIQRWLGELSVLKNRFALVENAKVLEEQLLAAKDAHDELAGALAQSRQFSSEDLDERQAHLTRSLKRLMHHRRDFNAGTRGAPWTELCKAEGAVYTLELTNKGNGWHPHCHMIALAASEPSQEALSAEWHRITGDSFIVDVRPIVGDPSEGFMEVFKYAVKFSDLSLEDNWFAAQRLKGKRLLNSFGLFRGVEVPESFLDEPLDSLPYWDRFYRFIQGEYRFTGESPKGKDQDSGISVTENRYTIIPADLGAAADLPGWRPKQPPTKPKSFAVLVYEGEQRRKAALRKAETRSKS